MLSFAYPHLLMLLLLIPFFIVLYVWARYTRMRRLRKLGNPEEIRSLSPDVSPFKPPLKMTVRMIALAMIIVAVARPWGGVKDQKSTKEGIEVIIAMDASNSMLAPVFPDDEGASRMRTAKLMLERLINRLDNDRVGLIVYAGNAYTLIPVTSDYVSAKMFLNSIDPSQIKNQGTNMAAAINLAAKSFSPDKNIGKAMVLITDAEDLENPEAVMDAAEDASKAGVQIDVVGVGSASPVKIPYEGSYMINPETGSPVETVLNEDLAADVAKAGKGIYVNASNSDALNELEKQLDTVKKTALESTLLAIHDELFHIFVWIALVLIIMDIFLLDRKISWLDRITFFRKENK